MFDEVFHEDVDHPQKKNLLMLNNMRINEWGSIFNSIFGDDDMVKFPCFTPISLCYVEPLDEIFSSKCFKRYGMGARLSALCLK